MFGLCYKRLQLVVATSCRIAGVDSANKFHCFQKGPRFNSSFSSKSLVLGRAQTHDKRLSFTVSYLIDSFGFSPELALSVSKKYEAGFNSRRNPDSVIKLLKDYGLSDAHISQIVKKLPRLLIVNPEKNLLPKLEFLNSIGISGSALARMLCSVPNLLTLSLERSLKPYYNFSTTLGIPYEKLPYFISTVCFRFSIKQLSNAARNVSILRAHDVPESSFPLWDSRHISALSFESEKVKENVKKVIGMGFCPISPTFMKALYVISVTDASKWKQKVEFYNKWGWSEDDVLLAFRKRPMFMSYSEKKVSNKMDFYLNKMGHQPADLVLCSNVLDFSLEKRIIPRCSVIRVLLLKGLLRKERCSLHYIMARNDKYFLDRFVIKFQEQVPELFSIFQGKMTLAELGLRFEEIGV